jgi:hypothetical protein
MTTMLIDAKQRTPGLPADLRQHLGERALSEWALAAMQTVEAQLPSWCGTLEGGASPQMLLTLLTYCYASGTYGSEDIEWDCQNDPTARSICANTCPDQETIRSFRRANREWIEACLACVYGRARGVTSAQTSREPSPIPEFKARTSTDPVSVARRKLELAIMFDMAMCE